MEKQNILNKSTINNEKSLLALPIEKIEEYIPEGEGLQQNLEFPAEEQQIIENNDDQLNDNNNNQSYDQEGTLPFDDIDN